MPTIKDVARACGVRPSTVSYVLNNSRPVAERTRQSILAAIEELGYHPSAVARGLSLKRMNTIGVILAQSRIELSANPYFGPVLDGVISEAESSRLNTTLFTGQIWSDGAGDTRTYTDGRCDGLILVSPHIDSSIVPALLKTAVPFVVIGENSDTPGVSAVDIENVPAAARATEYLLDLGHTRIAMLRGDPISRAARDREEGYHRALAARGIPCDDALLPGAGWNSAAVPDRVDRLLSLPPDRTPTAIFCANDDLAIAALDHLMRTGKRVPHEISVIGFDDSRDASRCTPRLTSMRQPMYEMGARAAALLVRCIADRGAMGEKIILPTELIVRESTGQPPLA